MKTKIIFLLLLASIIFLSAYERDQVTRYAHRYTRLTEGYSSGYDPQNDIWWNVNPFIYELERRKGAPANLAGYFDGTDCAHFVSQNLQAGGIPMYEDGYYDNSNYLGYISCKNMHTFATNVFPVTREDWYHTTFQDSFWMEEILNPFLETDHFPYYSSYNSLDFCSDIYFLKIYFSYIQYSYEDNFTIYIHHYPFSPYYNLSNYYTPVLFNYYNNEYLPIVNAGFSFMDYSPYSNNLYGYQANGLKWKAQETPHSNYQHGDFQIFCNYRTGHLSPTSPDSLFEIHYNNSYNTEGRTIRYRHAAICRSGSGNTARVSAHNNDRCDSLWSYAYCDSNEVYDPGALNSITFYNVGNSDGDLPNLCAYNNWGANAIITTSDPDSTADINHFDINDPIYIKYAFQNNGDVMIPDRFQVKIEYQNDRTVFDSVLYNGIYADSVIVESLDDPLIMPDIDSLIITVKLDAGTNTDYGTDWERTWNDQNWVESDETDNEFSKMIYKGLPKPTDVEIDVSPNRCTINIQWNGDSGLIYKIYSSTNPYDGFVEDFSGTYSGTSWTAPQPSGNRFYYVVRHEKVSNLLKNILTTT